MLSQTIGQLLPMAVAVALSPIPVVAVILMLGTAKARTNGPAFAVGWLLGLSVLSLLVVFVAGPSGDPSSTASDSVNWLQVGLGVLLLGMARRQWAKRPKAGEEPEMPAWMKTVDAIEPGRAFVLGVLLSAVNPKNAVLTIAAGANIAQAGMTVEDDLLAVVAFVLIGSVTVVGAVVAYLVSGERAAKPLASVEEFMAAHNAVIMMVILVILGAKLLGEGLGASLA